MIVKIVLVVFLMTFILERALRDEAAAKPAPASWTTTGQPQESDSTATDSDGFFSSSVFGGKMQPTIFLISN